jgi:serine/threonine-protein kinase
MVVQPAATSRRLLRGLLASTTNEEEARAYLQARLVLYSALMFWSFIALLTFLTAIYAWYPTIAPRRNVYIFAFAGVGLTVMAILWRTLLVRRVLAVETLYRLDVIYAAGIGSAFANSAYMSPELHAAAFTAFIFCCFAIFTRALVVPSSGKRTAVLSAIELSPMTAAAIGLAWQGDVELPGRAFVVAYVVVSAITVLLAASGSRIIYGLSRQVSEAMQLGQYTLERKIGEGGMGAVYRARHLLLRRPTAVKLLLPDRNRPEDLDRFEREVQHMSELTHPNTVAVFDYGRSPDGVLYYAMEYLGGGVDLEQLVRSHGAQPAGRVAEILAQICGALSEAHAAGLTHRDIKPANIILCERGGMPDVAKVVDFGLVKHFTADPGASSQVILGTPHYLAPEAITNPGLVGPAADLYAVGAVGYFLLTGKRVFEGATAVEVCVKHVTAEVVPPSAASVLPVPAPLEALILACLAKAPADRPGSAVALGEALRALGLTDWPVAEARRWWRDFAQQAQPAGASMANMTITVDLERRDVEAGRR